MHTATYGIALTLRALHHGENALARDLVAAAERHAIEHEVHHVALDLASWSTQHGAILASTAKKYDLELPDPPAHTPDGLLATVRENGLGTPRPPTGTGHCAAARSARSPSVSHRELPVLGDSGPSRPSNPGPGPPRHRVGLPPADAAADALDEHDDQGPLSSVLSFL
jgi:hypothetical protein